MLLLFLLFFSSFNVSAGSGLALSAEEELGRYLFNDVRLSFLGNRSCAVCHSPDLGWTNRFSRTPD
ncbi:MAG: cytochrome c peroxidase, partial [Plesiomonas sp.]